MIGLWRFYARRWPNLSPRWRRDITSNRGSCRVKRLAKYLVCTLLFSHLIGCDEQILHDLAERDANRVLSRLRAGNLDAKKVEQSDGRWAIAISSDLAAPALSFLDARRVLSPRDSAASTSPKSGLVPSREEQWFRYERSVSTSIEDSLGTVLGVLEARVHLNLPEVDPLLGVRHEVVGSGSVLLVVDDAYVSSDQEIAALVAGASGIPQAKITVMRSLAQKDGLRRGDTNDTALAEGETRGNSESGVIANYPAETPGRPRATVAAALMLSLGGFAILSIKRRQKKVKFVLPQTIQHEV